MVKEWNRDHPEDQVDPEGIRIAAPRAGGPERGMMDAAGDSHNRSGDSRVLEILDASGGARGTGQLGAPGDERVEDEVGIVRYVGMSIG